MSSWWNPLSWWGGGEQQQNEQPSEQTWSWWNPMTWIGGAPGAEAPPENEDGEMRPEQIVEQIEKAQEPLVEAKGSVAPQDNREEKKDTTTEKKKTVSYSTEGTQHVKNDSIAPRLPSVARTRPPALKKRTPSRAHLKERKSFSTEETIPVVRAKDSNSNDADDSEPQEPVVSPIRVPSGVRLPGMGIPGGPGQMPMFNPAAVKLKSVSRTAPKEKTPEQSNEVDFRSVLKKTSSGAPAE